MNKKAILTMVAFTVLVLLFPGFVHGAIPASEREALIALYNSTNGDSWYNNSGWKTPPLHTDGFAKPGTEGSWKWVTVSGDHVNTIDLGWKSLSGSIPSQLANLSNFRGLFLYNNQLSGSIPSQLGNLSQLQELQIQKNQLSGVIPSSFTNLTNIYYLDIGYNCLSATDPTLRTWLNTHDPDWEAHQDQCGSVITPPTVITNSVSSITSNSAVCGGNVTSDGGATVTARGVCWSTVGNPTIDNLTTIDGTGTGRFTSTISGLSANTWYHFRAYATNSSGTSYGFIGSFKTTNSAGIPTVTTPSVSSITSNSAACGGNITSDGGAPVTARGVCWSIVINPTINNSKTTDGSGTGSFTSSITGLTPGTLYYVSAYATNSMGTSYGWNESFTTAGSPGTPEIDLNHATLNFGALTSGLVTAAQTVMIGNNGSGTLNWSAAANVLWLSLNPSSGTGDSVLAVSVIPTGLAAGIYSGTISITAPNASNSPQVITVSLHVYHQGKTSTPFGDFATPREGSSVYSSIAVTGWVLDDIGVTDVKIYNGDTYISDAVFVEGARPDVEAAYPAYPHNYKAGWGYMLLTNFLPNGGNGTYTLIVKATDVEGNEVTLGSKNITVDNAHAVKPFGAIDTPSQGGTVTGSAFRNWGWVLTPQPNSIPTDGTTIDVWVDGVKLGHPTYNIYRSDVSSLFPGYANSNGAAGYFDFDSTAYENGVHSIFWTAADSGGNSDGIGSRYFTVQNTGNARVQSTEYKYEYEYEGGSAPGIGFIDTIPSRFSEPITFSKGFSADVCWEELLPDENGMCLVVIDELERVEIRLGDNITKVQGYLLNDSRFNRLPIGSTLDAKAGTFYWQPGPGFLGRYSLVFVLTESNGDTFKKFIDIKIVPEFDGIR